MIKQDKKKTPHQTLAKRYRSVIDLFRNSDKEPQDFVIECLKSGTVDAADAEELINYLNSNTISRAFSLANLSDGNNFQLALYETTGALKEQKDSQIFNIQLDPKLLPFAEEIHNEIEPFAHKVAELACQNCSNNDMKSFKKNEANKNKDILSSVLDMLPKDTTCH